MDDEGEEMMETKAREFTIAMPARMLSLPRDRRGYPVPRFVEWIEGEPDFRIIKRDWLAKCVRTGACWICGERLGANKVFVVGPMCCINRISSEPPSHWECARFAATACPFLSRPLARRREKDLPAHHVEAPGVMLAHNPEVTALWVTKYYKLQHLPEGVLFRMGDPERVQFWTKGRRASLEEVNKAVEKGLPILTENAMQEGVTAVQALIRAHEQFERGLASWAV